MRSGNRDGQPGLSASGPQRWQAEPAPLAGDVVEEAAARAELLELEVCGLCVRNTVGAQAMPGGNRDGQHGLSASGPQRRQAEPASLTGNAVEEAAACAELLELEACGLRVQRNWAVQAGTVFP